MKCNKCDGTGAINGGPMCRRCDGSGQSTQVAAIPLMPAAFMLPPTLETVINAGYSPEGASRIVAEEAAKAASGYPPYGSTPEPAMPHDPIAANVVAVPVPKGKPSATAEGEGLVSGGK